MSPLLDRMRDQVRTLHDSIRTERAYWQWARQFLCFPGSGIRPRWARRSGRGQEVLRFPPGTRSAARVDRPFLGRPSLDSPRGRADGCPSSDLQKVLPLACDDPSRGARVSPSPRSWGSAPGCGPLGPGSGPLVSRSLAPSCGPPMISPSKLHANRANARKSTGPKSHAGKGRASRNAVTHGMTSQPGEPTAAYREALAEWVGDLQPRGIAERTLAERACRAAWNLRRCDRFEDATSFKRDRDAGEEYELAEAKRAEAVGRRLIAGEGAEDLEDGGHRATGASSASGEDPALIVAELRRSSAGVEWLLARWGELARALKAPGGWTSDQMGAAVRLLGLRPEAAIGHPILGRLVPRSAALEGPPGGGSWFGHPGLEGALDAAEEADRRGLEDPLTVWLDCVAAVSARTRGGSDSGTPDRKRLHALVRSEREKLARVLRRVLKARAAEDLAGAADRAAFEESRSLSLCLRYATAASRDLHRAIRDLARLREEADRDDPDSPQRVADSPDGAESERNVGGRDAVETSSAIASEKLRNEPTEGPGEATREPEDNRPEQAAQPVRTPDPCARTTDLPGNGDRPTSRISRGAGGAAHQTHFRQAGTPAPLGNGDAPRTKIPSGAGVPATAVKWLGLL